jgi:hypothetical protein
VIGQDCCDFNPKRGAAILRSIKTLETIHASPPTGASV